MMKSDRNVFLDVDLKNPAQPIEEEEIIEKPPDPITPEEEQIFKKKNDLVLTKPEETKKSDRKTNQKRQVTPKIKAHLERIRKIAAESKAKKKAEKEGNKPTLRCPLLRCLRQCTRNLLLPVAYTDSSAFWDSGWTD